MKFDLTLWPSWQDEPKSTILMALRFGLHNSMFSGFRSQWIILSSGVARNSNAAIKVQINFTKFSWELHMISIFLTKKLFYHSSLINSEIIYFEVLNDNSYFISITFDRDSMFRVPTVPDWQNSMIFPGLLLFSQVFSGRVGTLYVNSFFSAWQSSRIETYLYKVVVRTSSLGWGRPLGNWCSGADRTSCTTKARTPDTGGCET